MDQSIGQTTLIHWMDSNHVRYGDFQVSTVVVHIGMFYGIILNVTDAACRAWCLKTLWIRTKAWPC
jgi:hypothetical protein